MFSPLRMITSLSRPVITHVVVVTHDAEVAGAEVALVVEAVGVERRVHVAEAEVRALDPDLALLAAADDVALDRHDLHVDARAERALGVGHLLVGGVDAGTPRGSGTR